jgi:hypothetical protein
VLTLCAGSLLADDKDKKDSASVKGSVLKFDQDKKSLTLKTADGEKDYALGEEVTVVLPAGQEMKASLKKASAATQGSQGQRQALQALASVLKIGNEVELVLAEKENTVKEVHWTNKKSATPPRGKPDGTKKDAPKKDDGK